MAPACRARRALTAENHADQGEQRAAAEPDPQRAQVAAQPAAAIPIAGIVEPLPGTVFPPLPWRQAKR